MPERLVWRTLTDWTPGGPGDPWPTGGNAARTASPGWISSAVGACGRWKYPWNLARCTSILEAVLHERSHVGGCLGMSRDVPARLSSLRPCPACAGHPQHRSSGVTHADVAFVASVLKQIHIGFTAVGFVHETNEGNLWGISSPGLPWARLPSEAGPQIWGVGGLFPWREDPWYHDKGGCCSSSAASEKR